MMLTVTPFSSLVIDIKQVLRVKEWQVSDQMIL
jgi:hypothetical protein